MPVISKITGAPFRFWCQKVLPAVYDDSLSYYELLCKVVDYLNKVMEDDINVVNLVNELEEFVNNYFDNLDVQQEINNKLDVMAEDGSLLSIIASHVDPIIEDYEATLDADLAEYKETMDADVADFKLTVNNAIDAQDTDIANVKTTVAEQNSDISVMQSQMNNFIDSYSDIQTFTDLYTATPTNGLHYINQMIDLSEPYTDYEELDIYWSYNSDNKVVRVKSEDLLTDGVYISWYVDKSPDTGIPAPMYIAMMKLVNGNAAHTQLTLYEAYSEEWNGLAASDATRNKATTASEYTAGEVYKIVGVTYTSSAELTDIRVSADATVYPTAGDAVRGQYNDLNSAMQSELHDNTITSKLPFNIVPGYQINQNTGAFDANNSWERTDYIDISNGISVNVSTEYTLWNCAFYDNEHVMLSFMSIYADTGTIPVPYGAKYLALSVASPRLSNVVVYITKESFKSNIEAQINEISARVDFSYETVDYEFVQGALNANNGSIDTSSARRISSNFIELLTETSKIHVAGKYQSNVFFYSTPNTSGYISNTGWLDGDYIIGDGVSIPANAENIRITLRNKADTASDISPSDVQSGEFSVQYVTKKADELDLLKYDELFVPTSNPNIMYVCRDSRVRNDIPPNSKYAIKATAYNQYDRVRFSVTKTTDGEYVAVHDVTINNLAVNLDGTPISTTINTADCSLAELNQYDWGLKYGTQYAGLHVPMLDECLRLASIYNLSVVLDLKWTVADADVDALTAMLAKYGQTDAIFFAVNPTNAEKFKAKNKRFSYQYAGTYEQMQAQLINLTNLLTGYNHVYLANRPLGEAPSTDVINFACINNFEIMYSPIEGMLGLTALGFDKGISLMECHYIENIKKSVMDYADSLIE